MTEACSEHCQTFTMEPFAKRAMPECRHETRNFSGQGRFCGTRALQWTFCQKHKKKSPMGKYYGVFS